MRDRGGGFHPSGYLKSIHSQSTSYYFTNFPEDYGTYKMWKVFASAGSVGDVYIPGKRDKGGRRFGFVRFKDEVSGRVEEKLGNLWIEGQKIWVNRARFNRDDKEKSYAAPHNDKKSVQVTRPWIKKDDDLRLGSQLGDQLERDEKLKGAWRKPLMIQKGQQLGEEKDKDQQVACSFDFNVPKKEMDRYRESYVGKVHNPEEVATIQESFFKEGFMSLKATHLGGRYVLLQGSDSEEIPDLLFSEKKWFADRFAEIQRWTPAISIVERFTWVQCFGVPIHAWSEGFFCQLASSVGAFARLDPAIEKKTRLDVGRMLITTELSSIDVSLKVKVNGCVRVVRMMEEPGGGFSSIGKLFGIEEDGKTVSDEEDMASTTDGRFFGAEMPSEYGSEGNSDDGNELLTGPRKLDIVQQTNLLSERMEDSTSLGAVSKEKEVVPKMVESEKVELNSNLRTDGIALAFCVESEDVGTFVPSFSDLAAMNDHVGDDTAPFVLIPLRMFLGPEKKMGKKKKEALVLRTSDLSDSSSNIVGCLMPMRNGVLICDGKKLGARFRNSLRENGESSGVKSSKLPRSYKPPKRKKTTSSKGVKKQNRGARKSGSVDSNINNSISDSNIKTCCRLHYRSDEVVPRRLWELGKQMGVSFAGKEDVVVSLIKEMEARDGMKEDDQAKGSVNQSP
ncbi:hypothetical protein RIF29_24381 [Crotalaria pallida]|uniref:RRM domain-containing protein n=1 Tax=Crotalaria pallida TaxID=3830 RepID=A0AAN9EJN5_CROPI